MMKKNSTRELPCRDCLPFSFEDDSLIRCIYKAGTADASGLTRRADYLVHAHRILNEPFRLKLKLQLADISSIDFDSRNSRHRKQARFYGPICDGAYKHQ